jgi:hypothetical protein
MSTNLKHTFNELSAALKALHKDLLMLEAKKLEAARGHALNPYELLGLSMQSPELAWLRVLSGLIVNIDTLIDEALNLSAQDSHRVANEVLTLLEKPPGSGSQDFWTRYSEYLSSNPDIIMRHSKVKEISERLAPVM